MSAGHEKLLFPMMKPDIPLTASRIKIDGQGRRIMLERLPVRARKMVFGDRPTPALADLRYWAEKPALDAPPRGAPSPGAPLAGGWKATPSRLRCRRSPIYGISAGDGGGVIWQT